MSDNFKSSSYKTDDPNWFEPIQTPLRGSSKPVEVRVSFVKLRPDAVEPVYQTSGASGVDLHSCEHASIPGGMWKTISTGLSFSIPSSYEGQVRPRSGMSAKHGITVLNAPGTIDSDYRGEVKVVLINHSSFEYIVQPGDRIAQLVFCRSIRAHFEETDSLDETPRGAGGFGSTGA